MTSTLPGHRCNTKLEELHWLLEKLPYGFPEVSREHIMLNVPLSILAISGVMLCKQTHVNELNRYLSTAAFRYAMIKWPGRKLETGNGSQIDIPYALNPNIEYSTAGKMLWYMKGEDCHPEMYRRLCVLQQLEWIIWQSKK